MTIVSEGKGAGSYGGAADRAASARATAWPTSEQLDSLRGLACLLLVGFHACEAALKQIGGEAPMLMAFHEIMEPIRMPLFSFLSGFIYALRPVEPGAALEFQSKKVRRLVVPFLCLTVLIYAMNAVVARDGLSSFQHYLVHPFSHLWFLQALFFVFLLYCVVDIALPRSRVLAATLVFAASLPLFLSPLRGISPFSFGDAAYILPFFSLGVLACRRRAWLAANARLAAAILAGAVALFLAYAFHTIATGGQITKDDPVILAMSLSSILLLLTVFPAVGWLARIGVFSFSIYLFHTIFTAVAVRVAPADLLLASSLAFILALCAPILVELAIARLFPIFGFVIGKPWRPRALKRS